MDNAMTFKTKKPMSKDEISLLLDLVLSRPIITSKETNAASNKLKDEAWICLTDNFNSKNGQIPRHKEQLKAKWDNLKKAARKRCQQIRLNNFKTGGGKPDAIPQDDILDRVAGQLGSTCMGFEVPFGGDGVGVREEVVVDFNTEEVLPLDDCVASPPEKPVVFDYSTTPIPKYISLPISEAKKRKADDSIKPRTLYGMSMAKELKTGKGKSKFCEDSVRRNRNIAITKYYEAKTMKLNLEIEAMKSEMAKKSTEASSSHN